MHSLVLPRRTVDVLREFTTHSIHTQPEIQNILGISPPTAFRSVEQLRLLGVLSDGESQTRDGRGRPATSIQINPDGLCVFALVIKTSETVLYLMDAVGKVRDYVKIPIASTDPYELAVEQYAVEVNRMLITASNTFSVTAGIGISFGGHVNTQANSIGIPSRFTNWHNRPLPDDLFQRTGLHCFIDNDTVSLTRATFWFSPKLRSDSFALLYLDFGMGTGFCVGKQVYTGRSHVSSGLGHTNLFNWSDEVCHCGKTGCIETVLSIPAVLKRAQKSHIHLNGDSPTPSTPKLIALEHEAQAGNAAAIEILSDVGVKAGILAGAVGRIFDLPAVVFSGGLIEISKTIWTAVEQEMTRQLKTMQSKFSWWNLREALENEYPEALGGSAVALGGLYQSRQITVLR